MSAKLFPSILLPVIAAISGCLLPPSEQEICIYTSRSLGQVEGELRLFLAAHPEIALRCPGADLEHLYCPSRLAEEKESCKDQDAEEWVALRQSTGSLTKTLVSEGNKTHADVLWGVGISHMWYLRENLGLLRPYEPQYFDRVYDMVMSNGRRNTLWASFIEPEVWDSKAFDIPTAVGMDAFAAIFCVNSEKMRAMDPGWDEHQSLTWTMVARGSDFSGKVVMPNPSVSGSGFAAIVGLLQSFKARYGSNEQVAEAKAWDFIRALDGSIALYTTTGDGPCNLVARADNDYVIGITHDAADMLPHGDEPESVRGVQRVFPAPDEVEGGHRMLGYDVAANAQVERGAASKPGAQVFLDWALSPEAIKSYSEKTPFVAYSVRDTPLPAGYPKDMASTPLDFNAISEARVEIQQRWLSEFCPESSPSLKARCFFEVK